MIGKTNKSTNMPKTKQTNALKKQFNKLTKQNKAKPPQYIDNLATTEISDPQQLSTFKQNFMQQQHDEKSIFSAKKDQLIAIKPKTMPNMAPQQTEAKQFQFTQQNPQPSTQPKQASPPPKTKNVISQNSPVHIRRRPATSFEAKAFSKPEPKTQHKTRSPQHTEISAPQKLNPFKKNFMQQQHDEKSIFSAKKDQLIAIKPKTMPNMAPQQTEAKQFQFTQQNPQPSTQPKQASPPPKTKNVISQNSPVHIRRRPGTGLESKDLSKYQPKIPETQTTAKPQTQKMPATKQQQSFSEELKTKISLRRVSENSITEGMGKNTNAQPQQLNNQTQQTNQKHQPQQLNNQTQQTNQQQKPQKLNNQTQQTNQKPQPKQLNNQTQQNNQQQKPQKLNNQTQQNNQQQKPQKLNNQTQQTNQKPQQIAQPLQQKDILNTLKSLKKTTLQNTHQPKINNQVENEISKIRKNLKSVKNMPHENNANISSQNTTFAQKQQTNKGASR